MGLSSSCCSKDDSAEALVEEASRIEARDPNKEEALDNVAEIPKAASACSIPSTKSDGKLGCQSDAEDLSPPPRLPAAVSAGTAGSSETLQSAEGGYSLRQLLRMGRFIEAEQKCKAEGKDTEGVATFLERVMPEIRAIAPKARLPSAKDGWTILEMPDIGMNIYLKRESTIDLCFSVDLPNTTWEMMLAMNWEADLSSQWLPFNPEVNTTYSDRASSLMMFVTAKVPMLPGSREVYIYRHVVDCFTQESVIDGRQGLLIVEKSPENWKTGGLYMDEFDVKAPSTSRWVTRDEQLESFTFYEYVNPTTIRCFIRYKLIFNVPSWLFPNSALHWLAKFTGRRWHAGLLGALEKFKEYGYQARVDARANPIYEAVLERALHRSRMDLNGPDGPSSP